MRTFVALVIGLAVAVGVAVLAFVSLDRPDGRGDAAAPIAAESDRAEIRERIRAMQDANNAGDVEAWVDGFAPDAVYMPPGLPAIATRAGLREIAESGFSSARTDVTLTPDEIEIAGDWAFARIRVEGVATVVADGRTIAIDMKELVVFRRQPDGSWRIARFMANRNAAS